MRVVIDRDTERSLVKRCRSGDAGAFRELFELFKNRVYATSLRILSNDRDAEDAAQETFIRVFRKIGTFRGDSSLVTWIYRITANICNDMLRKRQTDTQVDSLEEQDRTAEVPGMRMQPETTDAVIEREIAKLPPGCRTVFVLFAVEELKHEEIASILGVTVGTSKSQYHQARKLLRKQLSSQREVLRNGS